MRFLKILLWLGLGGFAMAAARAAPVNFDLPAQPAAAALAAFAKQAGVEVLFSFDDLKKVNACAVVGRYEPEEAVALLLQGTGFVAQRNAAGKFVVTRERTPLPVGEIRGSVVTLADGRPIAGAVVSLAPAAGAAPGGAARAVRTGENGAFALRGVPVEKLSLLVQADGYASLRVFDVAVAAGRRTELNPIRLPVAGDGVQQLNEIEVSATELAAWPGMAVALKEFVVTPSRFGIAEERIAKNVTLTKTELATLPQLGEDLYRTISRLPGLATDDLTAKFWVRGAPNTQMLARFDGVDLIEPFHLKDLDGALSIVDLQTIGSVDLVTGGFTTDYGDRLAGVLAMETQTDEGVKRRTTLGASVTNVRATSQGEFADGNGRWLAAARRGFLDLALKLGGSKAHLSPVYYDLSGKLEYRLNAQQTVSFHMLYAGDSFKPRHDANVPDLRSSYASAYAWGRWRGDFGERVSGESVLSVSRLDWHRGGNGLFDGYQAFSLRDNRRLDVVGLRQDWTVNLTEHALIRTGFEYKSGDATYDYAMSRQLGTIMGGNLLQVFRVRNAELEPKGDYQAAYAALRWQPFRALIVEPGVRYERHTYSGDSNGSPRLNASLAFGRTTVRAAWGIYRQAQGLQELSVQDGETAFRPAERAEQRVIGISRKLESGVDLRLEAYERLSSHLRPRWENLVDPIEPFPEALYDRVRLNPLRGRAQGVELIAEHRGGGRFGWAASYTYASAEEQLGARWVPVDRDQRHTFYADVTFVPARNWQLSFSWQFHTGWPVTDQIYTLQHLNDGTLSYSWTYGPVNSLRAPAYHRLDLRATRTVRLQRGTLRVFADIVNAYDQKNQYGYNHWAYIAQGQLVVGRDPLTLFPILPSAGVSWEF